MPDVAVAEVIAELDVGRHPTRQSQEALEDAALHVLEPDRKEALQHRELEVGVPLDGELIVRDLLEDEPELAQQSLLVRTLQHALVIGHHERGDRRDRRGQAHLEPAGHGDVAVALEAREDAIGGDGRVGVAQRLEDHAVGPRALGHAHAWQRPPAIRSRRHHLELGLGGEDGELPHDPVGARAGLPVGNAAEPIADLARDRAEDDLRAGQRHAPDEVNALDHLTSVFDFQRTSLGSTSSSSFV